MAQARAGRSAAASPGCVAQLGLAFRGYRAVFRRRGKESVIPSPKYIMIFECTAGAFAAAS